MNKFFFFIYVIFLSNSVFAYLEPGSGSIIIQVLIFAIASLLFFVKMFWFKIKKFFKNLVNKLFR